MMGIKESELILNDDGSVYHLNLLPADIATNIIFVGDQDRVEAITKHFDTIEFTKQKREFKTQTGTYKGKRLTVISTGIGPDNIDIVLNELDALVNIDFETKTVKPNVTSLNIVRIGTSGALHDSIPVDSILLSTFAIGTDNMLRSYNLQNINEQIIEERFVKHTNWQINKGLPYAIAANTELAKKFKSNEMFEGITVTAPGFYGAQGRVLRLQLSDAHFMDTLDLFEYNGFKATNLEMETAAIYGLAKLLGHKAVSLNAIVANRKLGSFSKNPYKTVDYLIDYALQRIIS